MGSSGGACATHRSIGGGYAHHLLGSGQLVAFVPTIDLGRAAAFYGDALGLRLVESTAFADVYDANGTMLRVTLVEQPARAPYTVLGWRVADVTAAVEALVGRGSGVKRYTGLDQDESGVWTAPSGSRIAWFEDPDGNVLSLEQPPAD